jgi:hypothetical protein
MRMGLRQWLTGRPSPESLHVELVERGRSTRTYDGGDSYYFRPKGEGIGPMENWDPRTREIGEALYRMADNKLGLMQDAHARVVESLGPIAGRCLEANWDRTGEDQWAKGMGQVWRS